MAHAKVRHFPKPYPLPDDPEPDPPAQSAGLPHYRDEKLLEVFAFRLPAGTRDWIHRRALQLVSVAAKKGASLASQWEPARR